MEQRICSKFCFKNEIRCNTVLEMLNVVFGKSFMNKQTIINGSHFKETHEDDGVLDGPVHQQLMRMSKKVRNNYCRISIKESAMMLEYHFAHGQQFFQVF